MRSGSTPTSASRSGSPTAAWVRVFAGNTLTERGPSRVVMAVRDPEKRSRHQAEHHGKHLGVETPENFSRGFEALGDLAVNGVQVSARATDLTTGRVLFSAVSYTHLRAHETDSYLVCRLLLE